METGSPVHGICYVHGIYYGNYCEQMASLRGVGLQRNAAAVIRADLRAVYDDLFRAKRAWNLSKRIHGILPVRGEKAGISCIIAQILAFSRTQTEPAEYRMFRCSRYIFYFMEGEKSGILTMYVKSCCTYIDSGNQKINERGDLLWQN